VPPAAPPAAAEVPHRGLTSGGVVARAYDTVLDADFGGVPSLLARTCGPAPEVACLGLRALATWWEIQLDPQSRFLDSRFLHEANAAIDAATAWTTREPQRAEAWFYLGAALGVRGQWRVLRNERMTAARDGKRIKTALERALALDPGMHDAEFGIGAYRYYADVAPSYLRWLRWLLLLPGGNRAEGLAQMERASRLGVLVGGEARYQLHVIYLWYERRAPEALALVRDLMAQYPHNPLFRQIEAEILDVYFHDAAASLAASEALVADAGRGALNSSTLVEVRARVNIAVQLDRLGQRETARAGLDRLLATNPRRPLDAVTRARSLQRAWRDR
jgi:hypothetical protein